MTNDINPQAGKLVGVEVSSSMLRAACLDQNGALLDSANAALSHEQEIFTQLTDFISSLKPRFGEFAKLGIAVPGLLNRETNRITLSKHIPENANIDLATEIHEKTGVEAVLENDANAAAYGEYL